MMTNKLAEQSVGALPVTFTGHFALEYIIMIARVGSPKMRFESANRQTKLADLRPSGLSMDLELPHGARLLTTGIDLPKELDFGQWKEVGEKLMTIDKGVQWAIGEWWRFGYHKYGERKQYAEGKGLSYGFQRLMDIGWVVSKVPTSSRNEVLSFTHHRTVASLEPQEQKKWLDKAERGKWTVEKLIKNMHDDTSIKMQRYEHHRGHQKLANMWAEGFLSEAKRPSALMSYRWDDARLDLVGEGMLAELVEAASSSAAYWTETATQLADYQRKRLAAGSSFKPRIPDIVDRRRVQQEADFEAGIGGVFDPEPEQAEAPKKKAVNFRRSKKRTAPRAAKKHVKRSVKKAA